MGNDEPVDLETFMAAHDLDLRHVERFEAEGTLRLREGTSAVDVLNAAEFVRTVVAPAGAAWPPPLPAFDPELLAAFGATADPALAARLLEPFRYAALGEAWERVVALARPSARFRTTDRPDAGRSRLGGLPDVSEGFEWPRGADSAPLDFIAQLDLAEVQAVCRSDLLPTRGLLGLFWSESWHDDEGGWAVRHTEAPAFPLAAPPAGIPAGGTYRPVPLSASPELTLPFQGPAVKRLSLDRRQDDVYGALWFETHELTLRDRLEAVQRMLGWPEMTQTDPAPGGAGSMAPTDGDQAWLLLAQVQMEPAAGMAWGDSGTAQFMIRAADLRQRRWERARLAFQCA